MGRFATWVTAIADYDILFTDNKRYDTENWKQYILLTILIYLDSVGIVVMLLVNIQWRIWRTGRKQIANNVMITMQCKTIRVVSSKGWSNNKFSMSLYCIDTCNNATMGMLSPIHAARMNYSFIATVWHGLYTRLQCYCTLDDNKCLR